MTVYASSNGSNSSSRGELKSPKTYSNLALVNRCDGFPNPITAPSLFESKLRPLGFFVEGTHTLGYLIPSVQEALKIPAISGDHWIIHGRIFSLKGDTVEERTDRIRDTCERWRKNKMFSILKGWRDELYSVYSPAGKLLFNVERAASTLFGIVTYGVHMSAYVETPGKPLRMWIPRRSRNKQTYGGMLDNTVAGGMSAGYGARATVVKEAAEEASLPQEVAEQAVCTGAVTYFYVREDVAGGETGLLQPEVQYVYDLKLSEDVIPKPCDGEVEEFYLWDVERVQEEMRAGNFKPNCAIVLLDFFVRHGIITPENEPDYLQIIARIHRRLPFPLR